MNGWTYKLIRYWDSVTAGWRFELRAYPPSKETFNLLATGDLAWAKRHATHYKIKVPKEETKL